MVIVADRKAVTTLVIAVAAASLAFMSTNVQAKCNLDLDGDSKATALTDGLLLLRHLLGLTDTALIQGALGSAATRRTTLSIQSHINGNNFDVDRNGSVSAGTDAVLILRYLLGYSGNQLVAGGAVGAGAQNATSGDVYGYIQTGCITAADLPPDPGPAANTALAGVDTNADGVRDEVERALFASYSSPGNFGEAMRLAKRAQAFLAQPALTTTQARTLLNAEALATRCLQNGVGAKTAAVIAQEVELRTFNTLARRLARKTAMDAAGAFELLAEGSPSCN